MTWHKKCLLYSVECVPKMKSILSIIAYAIFGLYGFSLPISLLMIVRMFLLHLDGLVQGGRHSSLLAMELRLSCTNPSILSSSSNRNSGGRRLVSGRWFLRFSKDTNGSITLRSISTSEWIMTLFAMASLIEFVPLLCLCILEPVRKLTHWGRVTHICVGGLTIIGSDNGLSLGRRQAIIWANAGMLLIGPLGTGFREMLIGI